MNRSARAEPTPPRAQCAAAVEVFDLFCGAGTMKAILGCHREICHTLNLKPNRLLEFYPKLKSMLASSWKAQALFKKFDARANHKVYGKGRACAATRVLVIGAGPCGLRAAIECQLLGAKVVVIEKRDRMSRNNVLHLWPFVIHDLRALGAKKFFGKFCAGSIDHISIRQLQCILLKVALLLGVEFHEGVSFEELLEPTVTANSETLGWRARVSPPEHPVSQYEFDVLLGADGKRNTLRGFERKEFRGKLAMAITANFINRHSEQEASVPEISGVAFIFNQKFFKELHAATGIDLENIVYYKDDTHYFVMTAKKHSLLDKGVLLNDYAEVSRLLAAENVDRCALMRYAQEAARFSTGGRLPLRDFALNHYGEPDVALFDFTSMFAAENASLVRERLGRRLLCQLVGDSLLEPFWPTGSGCARGFLSALDAAWAARAWGQAPPPHPLHVIAERESIYRLLAQTTPENLNRDLSGYTLEPSTRYPNLNRGAVSALRVTSFYDSDEPLPLDAAPATTARKRRRECEVPEEVLVSWVGCGGGVRGAASAPALAAAVRRYRPDLLPPTARDEDVHRVLQRDLGIVPFNQSGNPSDVPETKLRSYLCRVYLAFKGEVPHVHHPAEAFDQIKQSLQKEKHVRHAIDHSISAYSNAAEAEKSHSSNRKKRRGVRTPQEEGRVVGGGAKGAGGGARVARLAAELSGTGGTDGSRDRAGAQKPRDLMRSVGRIERDDWNVREIERKILQNRLGRPEPRAAERVPKWDREQFLGRQRRLREGDANDGKWVEIDETFSKFDQKMRDSGRPDHGTKKVANLATKFVKKDEVDTNKSQPKEERRRWGGAGGGAAGASCAACGRRVFAAEGVLADGLHLHRACFRCALCRAVLRPGNYTMERYGSRLVCLRHSGASARGLDTGAPVAAPTPERISLELSDGAREIDEDEWTDRNFLASETSGAGLSEEEASSSDEYTDAVDSEPDEGGEPRESMPRSPPRALLYCSDDSFGYDDYSDDGAESSGNESCSRMREAREARRREVPAEARPPTDSSEVESEEDSDSSDSSLSSATAVSTDSEFARDEGPAPPPPAILVTEAPPPPSPRRRSPPVAVNPLSRTRSAGGIATKRALELKRKYLLGETTPPTVRRSDSTSQIDTKLETFRSNITEFQKMLHPAPAPTITPIPTPLPQPHTPILAFHLTTLERTDPMPDIIRNLCADAPVDLLTKGDSPLCRREWCDETVADHVDIDARPNAQAPPDPEVRTNPDLESDSLSEDDSSHTATAPQQPVPRLEVHNEGGELIQLDSLTLVDAPAEVNANLIETEPTTALIGEKSPEDVVTIAPLAADTESSESGRDAATLAMSDTELSDVLDECSAPPPPLGTELRRGHDPRALGLPKLVQGVSAAAHVCGRTSLPAVPTAISAPMPASVPSLSDVYDDFEFVDEGDQDPFVADPPAPINSGYMELVDEPYESYDPYETSNDRSMNFIENPYSDTVVLTVNEHIHGDGSASTECAVEPSQSGVAESQDELTKDLKSPKLLKSIENEIDQNTNSANATRSMFSRTVSASTAICRSASDTFAGHGRNRERERERDRPPSADTSPTRDTTGKVQEIQRERDQQTEVVRRLVLERLGGARGSRRAARRARPTPAPAPPPPPVPPPPRTPPLQPPLPPPPPRPAPPVLPLSATPSFSDPELARVRRSKSIMKSISNYFNRRLGPRQKGGHKSTGALQAAPPVPPPPVAYHPQPPLPPPPRDRRDLALERRDHSHEQRGHAHPPGPSYLDGGGDSDERDAMQLWFEARWARLVAQRRARTPPTDHPASRRLARLERRLARPLSAEQQAATVAELVQVSAQRGAHQALLAADRRRSATSAGGAD